MTEQANAQTFTVLHNCGYAPDLSAPRGALILSDNTLYGTAVAGGTDRVGAVFKVQTDGSGLTVLHNCLSLGNDGANPWAGVILSSNALFGTANTGGAHGWGSVFSVNTDGTGYAVLHAFSSPGGFPLHTNSDGVLPYGGLVLYSNTLYGTTGQGGEPGMGTVFSLNVDGTGFTNLHQFASYAYNSQLVTYTNSDGSLPYAGLTLAGGKLYGTCYQYGNLGIGTVFAINIDGTGFTNLHNFKGASEGANPRAGLILSGDSLYGTTVNGGSSGNGTVFTLNTDGSGFRTIHSFVAASGEGRKPYAGLLLSGNTLYGTTSAGGSSDSGTVFSLHTDGTGFTTLYSFTSTANSHQINTDGGTPWGPLILSGNTLYGTTEVGGSSGLGTIFSLTLSVGPPQLQIEPSGENVILSWPTNATGMSLQSTTNLTSPAWTPVSAAPVVINDQNTVTNPVLGNQQFYRLGQ